MASSNISVMGEWNKDDHWDKLSDEEKLTRLYNYIRECNRNLFMDKPGLQTYGDYVEKIRR